MLGFPLALWLKAGAVAAVVIGALWLVDEIGDRREAVVNARWETRLAKAREGQRLLRNRQRNESEAIADKNKEEWGKALAISEADRMELEEKVGRRGTRVTCYPKDIIKALNK